MNRFRKGMGKPEDTIIVIGDYSRKPGVKGKPTSKGKGFRKMFRKYGYQIYLIDEFRTSLLCNQCHHKNERFFKIKTKAYTNPKTNITIPPREILSWKLLKCTNCKA